MDFAGPAENESDPAVIFSRENLIACAKQIRLCKGSAAGSDGIQPRDLSHAEACRIAGAMSGWLLGEQHRPYRPKPRRKTSIRKPTGGLRQLQIGAFQDRIVSLAIAKAISPILDREFSENSFGFRPGRSTLDVIARITLLAKEQDCFIIVSTDIRKAFDTVPVEAGIDATRRLLAKTCPREHVESVISTLRLLLGGHNGTETGIPQGDPTSPVVLNALLDAIIDRDWEQRGETGAHILRYADDIIAVCKSWPEARKARQWIQRRINRHGFKLRGSPKMTDLRREKTIVLGLQLGLTGNTISVQVPCAAWTDLRKALQEAHEHPMVIERSRQTIVGWLEYFGCGLETVRGSRRIIRLQKETDTSGSVSLQEAKERILASQRRLESKCISSSAEGIAQ